MCGICGYISSKEVDPGAIRAMNQSMTHRGPDSDGFFVQNGMAFAMRRLKVIDLDTGDQPIADHSGQRMIFFNGEVYNYRDLRVELQSQGYRFKTSSDTEVILAGYLEQGISFFSKMNGMFGLAILDLEKNEIVLARDRLGIKPLHYYQQSGDFVFGSEIKAILAFPGVTKEINYQALDQLFQFKYVPGEDTAFRSILRLRPGWFMRLDFSGRIVEYKSFWDLKKKVLESSVIGSYKESQEMVREALTRAVQLRMISDVPIGTFLSGGIDSCIITGLMAKLAKNPVKSFSIGFEEKSFNELNWARCSAAFHKTDHHEYVVEPKNLMGIIKNLVYHLDEPSGNYGMIPLYYVNQKSKPLITVALNGLGADEFFGGYERYWANKGENILKNIPAFIKRAVKQVSTSIPVSEHKKSFSWRLKKILGEIDNPPESRYAGVLMLLNDIVRKDLFQPEIANGIREDNPNIVEKLMLQDRQISFLKRASYTDSQTILPNDYLLISDRMSMANSLEVRNPFLDHELVELSMRIQDQFKIKGFTNKYILRDTFSDLIPPEIRKLGKFGFEAPFSIWLKRDLKQSIKEVLFDSVLTSSQIFNPAKIKTIYDEHVSGKNNHSKVIYALTTTSIWLDQHFN